MDNPYRAPQSDAPPEMITKPSQVTVFGILHIIVALFGFGTIIFNMMASQNPEAALIEPIQQSQQPPATFTPESLEGLRSALALNVFFEVFTSVLATMLLTSGLAMLFNARWGIKLSNVYALVSILLKAVTLVLVLVIALPGYQAFCDGISGGDQTLVTTVCLTLKITSIVSPLITLIYPIIALIFLTRPSVKTYQASL